MKQSVNIWNFARAFDPILAICSKRVGNQLKQASLPSSVSWNWKQ